VRILRWFLNQKITAIRGKVLPLNTLFDPHFFTNGREFFIRSTTYSDNALTTIVFTMFANNENKKYFANGLATPTVAS
jgi:hypothetical protein